MIVNYVHHVRSLIAMSMTLYNDVCIQVLNSGMSRKFIPMHKPNNEASLANSEVDNLCAKTPSGYALMDAGNRNYATNEVTVG